jgi:hypothetical protein
MTWLKVSIAFVLGVAAGVAVTRQFDPSTTRFAYRSRMEVVLADAHGNEVGSIPPGSTLFSSEEPDGADIGFQAYLPVSLGTGSEAKVLIVPTSAPPASSSSFMLNGEPRVNVLHPKEKR